MLQLQVAYVSFIKFIMYTLQEPDIPHLRDVDPFHDDDHRVDLVSKLRNVEVVFDVDEPSHPEEFGELTDSNTVMSVSIPEDHVDPMVDEVVTGSLDSIDDSVDVLGEGEFQVTDEDVDVSDILDVSHDLELMAS